MVFSRVLDFQLHQFPKKTNRQMCSLIPDPVFISWTAVMDKALKEFLSINGNSFRKTSSGKWVLTTSAAEGGKVKLKKLLRELAAEEFNRRVSDIKEKSAGTPWIFVMATCSPSMNSMILERTNEISSPFGMQEDDISMDPDMLVSVSDRLFLELSKRKSKGRTKICFIRHQNLDEEALREIVQDNVTHSKIKPSDYDVTEVLFDQNQSFERTSKIPDLYSQEVIQYLRAGWS